MARRKTDDNDHGTLQLATRVAANSSRDADTSLRTAAYLDLTPDDHHYPVPVQLWDRHYLTAPPRWRYSQSQWMVAYLTAMN